MTVDSVVTPSFLKYKVHASFLGVTPSVFGRAFPLGFSGAILAIPLALALKKIIEKISQEENLPWYRQDGLYSMRAVRI